MSSTFGTNLRVTIFGESHGPAIGAVIDSPPPGILLDRQYVLTQIHRRAPGQDSSATPRREQDIPQFLSGILEGKTTGAPLTLIIKNTNVRSQDYEDLRRFPRPSHADYAASVRYGGFQDVAGGGHFSGRLTAPLVAAASVLRPALEKQGIFIGGHVSQIGSVKDDLFNPTAVNIEQLKKLSGEYFSVINPRIQPKMRAEIKAAAAAQDSVGGAVELAVAGLPAGLGDPMFNGLENRISQALFGVPAVKAVAFGAGFGFASARGSEVNDSMYYNENGEVCCRTNFCGGITGGISNGAPLLITVALKPTPSISKAQQTVDLLEKKNAELKIRGRHDPCIVPRALPALEAALTLAVADLVWR